MSTSTPSAPHTLEQIPATSVAEREVADLLPINASRDDAEQVRDSVPVWFHTFQLAEGIYTPGIARDHRYRIPAIQPERFRGRSVLDIGTFDGFYAFVAEAAGASRVVAIDNEQYVDWIEGRFGVTLEPAAGFNAIHGLLGSRVDYRRLDARQSHELGERFDVILCFGMLHRVLDPLGLLIELREILTDDGHVVIETYGSTKTGDDAAVLDVHGPGSVYAGDDYVYWGFPAEGLERMAKIAGFETTEIIDQPTIAGHPRILATIHTGS